MRQERDTRSNLTGDFMTVSISLTITSTGLSSPSVSRYSRPSPFILRASGRRPARRAEMHGEEDERNEVTNGSEPRVTKPYGRRREA